MFFCFKDICVSYSFNINYVMNRYYYNSKDIWWNCMHLSCVCTSNVYEFVMEKIFTMRSVTPLGSWR